jgi:hypothetical protein
MTKNLTTTELPPPTMELDLDTFLNSPLTSDDDDDDRENPNSVPHRTIDEILNASDSSTSSSPHASPPSIHLLPSDPKQEVSQSVNDAVSVSSPKAPSESSISETLTVQSKPGSFARVRPGGGFKDDTLRRALPSLFGGVRPNAKPGAALAAATAASRALPTPHAAAIKSRRAANSQVVSEGSGSANGISDEKMGDFQSAEVSRGNEVLEGVKDEGFGEVSHGKEVESEAENVAQVDGLRVSDNDGELAETSTSISNSNVEPVNVEEDASNGNLDENACVVDENNSEVLDADGSGDKGSHSLDEFNEKRKVEEDSTMEALETPDLGKEMHGLKDDEDMSSLSDITELVEERIGLLESKRISKRAEQKSRASMKPLELAEELEKKNASTGLHWEEGAAAQPMRLEGVRRGSTTLGYFDIEADNTITRTISSHPCRRDYGSPQVLAVHTSYIAVGMSKGVILVVPSKYSCYNPDHTDAKVTFTSIHLYCSYPLVFNVPSGILCFFVIALVES